MAHWPVFWWIFCLLILRSDALNVLAFRAGGGRDAAAFFERRRFQFPLLNLLDNVPQKCGRNSHHYTNFRSGGSFCIGNNLVHALARDSGSERETAAFRPLEEYFDRHGLESAEIIPAVTSTASPLADDTVCVKTVIFQAKGSPFATVLRQDFVADPGRLARHFGIPKRQVTLAGAAFVEELTGFSVGTIPPLGHRTRIPILVDKEVLQYATVVGGSGHSEYDATISVNDFLKATSANVVEIARPRAQQQGVSATAVINGGSSTGPSDSTTAFGGVVILDNTFPFLRSPPSGTAEDEMNPVAFSDDTTGRTPSTDAVERSSDGAVGGDNLALESNENDKPEGKDSQIGDDFKCGSDADSCGDDLTSPAVAKLRVVTAAMRTVAAALSAFSYDRLGILPPGSGIGREGEKETDAGERVSGVPTWKESFSRRFVATPDSSSNNSRENNWFGITSDERSALPAAISTGEVCSPEPVAPVAKSLSDSSAGLRPTGTESSADSIGPSIDRKLAPTTPRPEDCKTLQMINVPAVGSAPTGAAAASTAVQNGARNDPRNDDDTPEALATGTAGSASETKGFGKEFARSAGTPTVDAIGGDVHLVAVVAGKRSLTRLLHFVDLVPPVEPFSAVSHQTCLVRRSWMSPPTADGTPARPVQVQLIMGKTLVSRLGAEDARVVMRGVKRGQLLYVTGRPTPDTRRRFGGGGAQSQQNDDVMAKVKDVNAENTYDLVCCSLRLLEDVPLVDEDQVGQGDDWENVKGNFLKMDLPEAAVTYVDTARGLKEMGDYLRETLAAETPSTLPPAVAVDCEWRPTREVGEPKSPVSLLQLAAGERTFLVDMLYVCRPRPEAASALAAARVGDRAAALPGLTKTETLLEEAVGEMLGAPRVVKVGMGPKTDFLSLMRSYPHLSCFRRVFGVVDLSDIARNASSLRGKPAEEKGSLSRLSGLKLGKGLDKSEQCSDWGMRPLSGRQKRYAALDARATLLLYRALAPEVPAQRMESLISTYTFDHRAYGIVATQTLPSSSSRRKNTGGRKLITPPNTPRKSRWRGTSSRRESIVARNKMHGVSVVNVSEAPLDVQGLRQKLLGKALLPDLTKEAVVRACIDPTRGSSARGEGSIGDVLRFNRHQSFIEFRNGFALLMNCGGSSRQREHASCFLDENGSLATWYLHGTLSNSETPSTSSGPGSAAGSSYDSRRSPSGTTTSESHSTVPSAAGGGTGEDSVGRFLERLADASDADSSILGGLPREESTFFPTTGRSGVAGGSSGFDGEGTGGGVSEVGSARMVSPVLGHRDDGGVGDGIGDTNRKEDKDRGCASSTRVGQHQEAERRNMVTSRPEDAATAAEPSVTANCHSSGTGVSNDQVVQPSPLPPPPPQLVLFARAKGRPFVYCGEVDCIHQEYVGSNGSTRLGAVRLTLALREWREAAAAASRPCVNDSVRGVVGVGVENGGRVGVEDVDQYRKSDEFRRILEEERRKRLGEDVIDGFESVVKEGLRLPAVIAEED